MSRKWQKYMVVFLLLRKCVVNSKEISEKQGCACRGVLVKCQKLDGDLPDLQNIGCTGVSNMIIRDSDLTRASSDTFCRFSALKTMQIQNSVHPSPGSVTLGCLNLKTMMITESKNFMEDHLRLIANISTLEKVSLQKNNLTDIPTRLTYSLPALNTLDMQDNNIKDVNEESVQRLSHVDVKLQGNDVCKNNSLSHINRKFMCKSCSEDKTEESLCLNGTELHYTLQDTGFTIQNETTSRNNDDQDDPKKEDITKAQREGDEPKRFKQHRSEKETQGQEDFHADGHETWKWWPWALGLLVSLMAIAAVVVICMRFKRIRHQQMNNEDAENASATRRPGSRSQYARCPCIGGILETLKGIMVPYDPVPDTEETTNFNMLVI